MGLTKKVLRRLSFHSSSSESPPRSQPSSPASSNGRRSLDASRAQPLPPTPILPLSTTKRPLDPSLALSEPAPDVSTAKALDGAVVDREAKVPNVATGTSSTSHRNRVLHKRCEDQEHWDRTKQYRDIKEGQPRDDKHTYLKPVVHETKFHHETEEITRVMHRERHTHEVYIHELPIVRPRQIATRAWITVETEVLPLRPLAEDGVMSLAREQDLQYRLPSAEPSGPTSGSHDGAKCPHPGMYQEYAQRVHDRAVQMLEADLAHTLAKFEQSLASSPISPAATTAVATAL